MQTQTNTTNPFHMTTGQLKQQLSQLLDQQADLMEVGHELNYCDPKDPELPLIQSKLNEVESEIEKLETIQRLYH